MADPASFANGVAFRYFDLNDVEINCRLMDAFDMTTHGWDDATVFSPPAVALAAGKLMKLSPDKLAQAISLAMKDHIPMRQTRAQGLSTGKGLLTPKQDATRFSRRC